MSAASQNRVPGRVGSPLTADVALLTIIPEAFEAVRQVFELTSFDVRSGIEWAYGTVASKGSAVTVVSGLALDRENVAAATFTDALLDAWRPRHLLLVDIGGAVKGRDDVEVGDVVTHTYLHYYDFKKEMPARAESPRQLPHAAPSARLRELSRRPGLRGDRSWQAHIHVRRPAKGNPKVLEGEMLVGGTLFANSPRLHRLLKTHPKVVAVEMEGVGAARAVLDWGARGETPEFLIIRGMSDFCNVPPAENQRMRDRWKRYAAGAAAAHSRALVSEMALPRPPTAGGTLRFQKRDGPLDNLWLAPLVNLTGREQALESLVSSYSTGQPDKGTPRRHAVYGEAGMGKSAVARQVAERLGGQFQVRWWVDAADELKIRAGLRELARQLGIPSACMELGSEGDQEGEAHRYLSDLREYLGSGLLNGRALIVLDNVDDPTLKHEIEAKALRYLPAEQCDVLLTSQSGRWRPLAEAIQLLGLDPDAGAQLIARDCGRPDFESDADVRSISAIFGGRPLLLKQVAVLLRDGDEPSEVRLRFENTPERALEGLPELEGFDPLWRVTFEWALERAERARPGARRLLEVLCCWSAEPIPLWLIGAVEGRDRSLGSVEVVLNTLLDRCLVERQGEANDRSYSVHRIVAALVRTLAKERRQFSSALRLAALATQHAIPGRDPLRRPEGQRLMAALAPHVSALVDNAQRSRELGLSMHILGAVAECASMLGLHRRTMSEWVAAERANEVAVALSDRAVDPGGAALRSIRLANVLRQRGQFERAEALVRDALPQLARYGDPCDHAWGITVEARILRHRPQSSPREALARLQSARPILEASARRHEPQVVRQISELHGYLSVLHRQLSELDAAEAESEAGLRMMINGADPEHVLNVPDLPDEPLLATHLRALGGVWRLRGNFARASLAHRRALEIFERIYGSDHSDVCRALDSLGRVQREWGDFEAALLTFERAGRISDAQFGVGHAHAGTAACNRALTHLELGDAHRAYEEADLGLKIYKHAYREPEDLERIQNEATVWALFVRADALAGTGNLDAAIHDHELVRAWRRERLRPGHAHQASSLFALAEVIWQRDGEAMRDQVLGYHREALAIRQDVFGSGPSFWLAQSQARLGSLTSDAAMLKQALECFSAQLQPGHWRTRATVAALATLIGTNTR